MKRTAKTTVLASIAVLGFALPAAAQENEPDPGVQREIEKLERRLQALEAQLAETMARAERAAAERAEVEARRRAEEAKTRLRKEEIERAVQRHLEAEQARRAAEERQRALKAEQFGLERARREAERRRKSGAGGGRGGAAGAGLFARRFEELLVRARKGDARARRELVEMRRRIDRTLDKGRVDRPFEAPSEEIGEWIVELPFGPRDAADRNEVDSDSPFETADQVVRLARTLASGEAVQERYRAAVMLARHPAARATDALVHALKNDDNGLVRRAAALSLGSHGKAARGAIPALIEAVGDEDAYVGFMAHRALESLARTFRVKHAISRFDPTAKLADRKRTAAEWARAWAEWEASRIRRAR